MEGQGMQGIKVFHGFCPSYWNWNIYPHVTAEINVAHVFISTSRHYEEQAGPSASSTQQGISLFCFIK